AIGWLAGTAKECSVCGLTDIGAIGAAWKRRPQPRPKQNAVAGVASSVPIAGMPTATTPRAAAVRRAVPMVDMTFLQRDIARGDEVQPASQPAAPKRSERAAGCRSQSRTIRRAHHATPGSAHL